MIISLILSVVSFNILSSDVDNEQNELTLLILNSPSLGTISVDEMSVTYTANLNTNGSEVVEFKVSDGSSSSNLGYINIMINPVNDAPLIDSIADQTIDEDQSATVNLSASDVDEDQLSFSASGSNVNIEVNGSTLIVTKGTLQPATNNGNDLGATGTRYKDLWLQGNADLEGDIDVNGTANLDVTDIDGTLDVAGIADFQSVVDAQASLTVTGSVYVSAGASVTAASASLVSFRNDSTTQLGYLASADTQAVTTGLVGYNTSNGNLTTSSVIDGGSF